MLLWESRRAVAVELDCVVAKSWSQIGPDHVSLIVWYIDNYATYLFTVWISLEDVPVWCSRVNLKFMYIYYGWR